MRVSHWSGCTADHTLRLLESEAAVRQPLRSVVRVRHRQAEIVTGRRADRWLGERPPWPSTVTQGDVVERTVRGRSSGRPGAASLFQVGVGRRPGMPSAAPCQPKCCARRLPASCAESRLPAVVFETSHRRLPIAPGPQLRRTLPHRERAGERIGRPGAHHAGGACRQRTAPSWPKGDAAIAPGHPSPAREHAPVVPGRGDLASDKRFKMPSSCTNLVGAAGIEPATARL